MRRVRPTLTLAVLALAMAAHAAEPGTDQQTGAAAHALKKLSLEELMNVQVYSASRRLEPTHSVPSATYVLTSDDIRRSGATSVPEALRLVPGVQVGRVDANKWAVSMRGFNSREANKLLVLVDGRTVYDPLFSGMLWESQDLMLEDVDRIEVVRGPGGTLWGANAVNGVINVITRNSRDTKGGLVSAIVGDEELYTGAARYGWAFGEDQHARVYVKAFERDEGYAEPVDAHDASRMKRAGFRWDMGASGGNAFRVSGDIFDATTGIRENPAFVQDIRHKGRNLIARWNRNFTERNSMQLRSYVDRVDYDSFSFSQRRDTYDLELQQSLGLATRHLLVWGAGYRRMRDRTRSGLSGLVDVLPLERSDEMKNVFAQDTITLLPDQLKLLMGIKYEATDYADSEWLPNLRLVWTPSELRTWWGAVSQAARVPSRLESDLTFGGFLRPGDTFGSEHVTAYELGTRALAHPRLWYDLALFYNDYDDLRTTEAGFIANLMEGHTKGAELALRWEPSDATRIDLSYTYLEMNLGLDGASVSDRRQLAYIEGLAARHQISLRGAVDLGPHVRVDATVRAVDELDTLDIPAYAQLDLNLTWLPRPQIELALVGRNLLDDHQREQAFAFSASGVASQVERSFFGRITWSF